MRWSKLRIGSTQSRSIAVSATTFSSRNSSAPFVDLAARTFAVSASPRLPIVRIAMSSALRTLRIKSEGSHPAADFDRTETTTVDPVAVFDPAISDAPWLAENSQPLFSSAGRNLLPFEYLVTEHIWGNAVVRRSPVDDDPD